MRILYLSRESPLLPGGGIATYLGQIVPAMQAAGHEVFLFSWVREDETPLTPEAAGFAPDHIHMERYDPGRLRASSPDPHGEASVSDWLAPRVLAFIEAHQIEVVEAVDFEAPALTLFQHIKSGLTFQAPLCVTFHHGFVDTFFEADQLRLTPDLARLHMYERQQCRLSDLVIAPSEAARARLQRYGLSAQVRVIREPFAMPPPTAPQMLRPELTYLGRMSMSKGIDKLIYFANALNQVCPLEQITLIGSLLDTPFREKDMARHIRTRLHPGLAERTTLHGFLDREAALALLKPGALAPAFSTADTFSYACIESIAAGLIPVVLEGTPMVEFLPPELRHLALDARMPTPQHIQSKAQALMKAAPELLAQIQTYCRETLDPARIAIQMTETYETARAACHTPPARSARAEDITVLVPAHRPGPALAQMVDTLAAQDMDGFEVIIVDDGSPSEHRGWFDYARTRLPQAQIISQPHAGLSATRNVLTEACQTPLALFLDADDMLRPEALSTLLHCYNHSPLSPDAVRPQAQLFGHARTRIWCDSLDDHMHLLTNDVQITALIRLERLKEIGFDGTARNGEDTGWAFWLDFTLRGYRSAFVPKPLLLHRHQSGTLSNPPSEGQQIGTFSKVKDVLSQHPGTAERLRQALFRLQSLTVEAEDYATGSVASGE